MRHARIFLFAITFVLLTACGGRTVYMNPERSPQDEEKDYYDCLYEAQKATGNLDDSGDREDRIEEMIDSCMRSKGYSQ